ncbi:MAG: hypothetical protein ACI8TQ_002801 [Planctomycetota bacterium]
MNEQSLVRALNSLAPSNDHLIIVGGSAHRLFVLHPLGREPGFELLTTEDVDIAAPLELRFDKSQNLLSQLNEAGFVEEVRGADEPTYIYRSVDEQESYVQFIAPLKGSGIKRDGTKDRLLRFSGINAEKLQYVDLL